MRALRDPDAFPETDLVLRRILDRHDLGRAATDAWRPWRAYAAMHLWNQSHGSPES
jgi:3-methyladenine DNA glycosylase/8-oxoguanine DNA glycosylase